MFAAAPSAVRRVCNTAALPLASSLSVYVTGIRAVPCIGRDAYNLEMSAPSLRELPRGISERLGVDPASRCKIYEGILTAADIVSLKYWLEMVRHYIRQNPAARLGL